MPACLPSSLHYHVNCKPRARGFFMQSEDCSDFADDLADLSRSNPNNHNTTVLLACHARIARDPVPDL